MRLELLAGTQLQDRVIQVRLESVPHNLWRPTGRELFLRLQVMRFYDDFRILQEFWPRSLSEVSEDVCRPGLHGVGQEKCLRCRVLLSGMEEMHHLGFVREAGRLAHSEGPHVASIPSAVKSCHAKVFP